MMQSLFLFLCFFAFILFARGEKPERCEELSVIIDSADVNTKFYLILGTTRSGNTNLVTIRNYTEISQLPPDTPSTTANPYSQPYFAFFINDINLRNSTIPYSTNFDDGNLDLSLQWEPDFDYKYAANWGFFINNANLIFYDGRMFDENNKCMVFNPNKNEFFPNWSNSNTNITTCCTSFKTIVAAPTSYPKCTKFAVTSTIIYVYDNSSIFTTSNANFVLTSNNYITANGYYGGTDVTFKHGINNFPCQISINNTQYCYYDLDNQDKTLFIQIYPFDDSKYYSTILAGQIILRDNQTLISDGIPFSTSNMCINKISSSKGSYPFPDNMTVISEICCTSFDDSVSAPTDSSTNVKNIIQKCSELSIYFHDSVELTFSANFSATAINSTHNIFNIYNFSSSSPNNENINIGSLDDHISAMTIELKNGSATFIVPNTPISVVTDVGFRNIFFGSIDNGSFIAMGGQLFDSDNYQCNTFTYNSDIETYFYTKEACCTKYEMVEAPDTYKPHPKCEKFNVFSSFFSLSEYYVYTTASADFILTETDLTGIGNFRTKDSALNYVPIFYINAYNFEMSLNGSQFGGYPVDRNNSEFLIHVGYYKNPSVVWHAVPAGRIIVLDGQTLKEQGVPFTAEDNCASFLSSYYDGDGNEGVMVESKICCTKFASWDVTLSSQTLQTTTTATTPTDQCYDTEGGCEVSIDMCKKSAYKPFMCRHCRKTCNLCSDIDCLTFGFKK